MSARLYVRPIVTRQYEGQSEKWRGSEDQVRGFLANRALCSHISERAGGMYGDWCDQGMIPDLPPLDLADLNVEEWQHWRCAISALEKSAALAPPADKHENATKEAK